MAAQTGRVTKPRARRSHITPSKASHGKAPDTAAYTSVAGIDLPPNDREQSPVVGDPPAKRAQFTKTDTPTETWKRGTRLRSRKQPPGSEKPRIAPHSNLASGPPTSKRAKLTRTNTPLPKVEHEEVAETGRQRTRVPLTQKNLGVFNKVTKGGKGRTDKALLSTDTECWGSSSSPSAPTSDFTMSTNFATKAFENGILQRWNSKPPTNLEAIRQRLAQPRVTTPLTESMSRTYIHHAHTAPSEATIAGLISSKLLKEYEEDGYAAVQNKRFTGLPDDAGFNNGLPTPQPDFVQGLQRQEYFPFQPDQHISGAALYSGDVSSITLPHLAGEFKGPSGEMRKAELQCAYDGAALVYARNQALSLIGEPDPPGHASIMTFATDGIFLSFFAHYAAPSEDGSILQYHICPVTTMVLTNSYRDFEYGRKALRNEQDHAKNQSYALRDRLREYWKKQQPGALPSSAEAAATAADSTLKDKDETA